MRHIEPGIIREGQITASNAIAQFKIAGEHKIVLDNARALIAYYQKKHSNDATRLQAVLSEGILTQSFISIWLGMFPGQTANTLILTKHWLRNYNWYMNKSN